MTRGVGNLPMVSVENHQKLTMPSVDILDNSPKSIYNTRLQEAE